MAETSHLSCLRKRRPQWPGGRFSWRRFRGVAFIAAVSIEVREVRSGDCVQTMGKTVFSRAYVPSPTSWSCERITVVVSAARLLCPFAGERAFRAGCRPSVQLEMVIG